MLLFGHIEFDLLLLTILVVVFSCWNNNHIRLSNEIHQRQTLFLLAVFL